MINKKKNALAPTKKNSVLCPPINAVPVGTTTSSNNKQQQQTTRTHNTNRQQKTAESVTERSVSYPSFTIESWWVLLTVLYTCGHTCICIVTVSSSIQAYPRQLLELPTLVQNNHCLCVHIPNSDVFYFSLRRYGCEGKRTHSMVATNQES